MCLNRHFNKIYAYFKLNNVFWQKKEGIKSFGTEKLSNSKGKIQEVDMSTWV